MRLDNSVRSLGAVMQRGLWRGYLITCIALPSISILAELNRGRLSTTSIALVYLVIVLASAAVGGIEPGIFASVIGFLTFNFFFLPPYYTFIIGAPQDIVTLCVFLIVAIVTSQLVSRLKAGEQ